MLEKYFSAPKTLRRLRGGISGPYVDAFADDLNRDGYAPASAVRYIRSAAHPGCFVHRRGGVLADIDLNILDSFSRHLRRCRCPHFRRGKISYHAHFGVKLFHHHLVERGICKPQPVDRRIQRHNARETSRPGDLTDVGSAGIALRRRRRSSPQRHRLEQRHVAGNRERAIPGAIAAPAGCR